MKKTAEVIKYVEQNPDAIGIIGNNWLNDKRDTTNLTFKRNIRVMSLSKIHPATPRAVASHTSITYTMANILSSAQSTPFSTILAKDFLWGFAHFIQGPKGQRIVMKTGLLPVLGNINVRDVNAVQ